MSLRDPKRLIDSEPLLAPAIRAERQRSAAASDIARLSERLERALVTQPPPLPAASSIRWKTIIGLCAGALALLTTVHQPRPRAPEPANSQITPAPNSQISSPSPSSSSTTPLVPRTQTARPPKPPKPPPPAPASELALLQSAQAALTNAPERALSLCEEHLRTYPRGVFGEEREMLAIEALQKLRRKTAALQRAQQFVQHYPHSPHTRRIRALLDASLPAP